MTTEQIEQLTDTELALLASHGIAASDRAAAVAELERRQNEGDQPGEGNPNQWR